MPTTGAVFKNLFKTIELSEPMFRSVVILYRNKVRPVREGGGPTVERMTPHASLTITASGLLDGAHHCVLAAMSPLPVLSLPQRRGCHKTASALYRVCLSLPGAELSVDTVQLQCFLGHTGRSTQWLNTRSAPKVLRVLWRGLAHDETHWLATGGGASAGCRRRCRRCSHSGAAAAHTRRGTQEGAHPSMWTDQ